jgi:hypothetical protein
MIFIGDVSMAELLQWLATLMTLGIVLLIVTALLSVLVDQPDGPIDPGPTEEEQAYWDDLKARREAENLEEDTWGGH